VTVSTAEQLAASKAVLLILFGKGKEHKQSHLAVLFAKAFASQFHCCKQRFSQKLLF
jgi:hypothetical protein